MFYSSSFIFFFFNDTATTEIYTLSLHDALPISDSPGHLWSAPDAAARRLDQAGLDRERSEEHTSELQSQSNLVCRLLLEKKKIKNTSNPTAFPIKSTSRHKPTHAHAGLTTRQRS